MSSPEMYCSVAWEKITYNEQGLPFGQDFEKQMFNSKIDKDE